MVKLFLFDVDGTIVDSGCEIDNNMAKKINKLKHNGHDIGIVGGGKLDKILKQMNDKVYFKYYFTECGCVYYKNQSDNLIDLKHVYSKDIRNHELYPYINILIKTSLGFLSQVDYTITGNFIDLRTGVVYISLIGMSANEEERSYFKDYDRTYKIRENLINLLKNKSKELKIEEKISIVEGGSVGIALYPVEWDKVQVLPYLSEYDEIHYFGDKYEPGGNDYNIINHASVKGHRINNKNILC